MKLYRIKWHLKKLCHIDIELNTNCNQSCVMCWQPIPKKIMPLEKAKQILRDAYKIGIRSVKFNFRGEPTVNPYLSQIIKYAKDIGYKERMINTNGINIDYDSLDLTHIAISVDSFHLKTYNKIHNRKSNNHFYKLMNNLKTINKKKDRVKKVINIHLNEYNQNENFKPAEKKYNNFKFVYNFTRHRAGDNIAIKEPKLKSCLHPKRRITVHVDGRIYACCHSYDNQSDLFLSNDFRCLNIKRKLFLDAMRHNYIRSCKNCKRNT